MAERTLVRTAITTAITTPGPPVLAGERALDVPAPLATLLPAGLRRGSVVRIGPGSGGVSLALASVAAASQAGSWVAAVRLPSLGVVAAAEAGLALGRVALVPEVDAERWPQVLDALIGAVDVVLTGPPPRVRRGDARRLVAKARREHSVLVLVAGEWPEPADVRLSVTASRWEGLRSGAGRLRARQIEVVADGRGAASLARRLRLWLPAADGNVREAGQVETARAFVAG